MDWARDWLGKDILASECKTRHGLICPTCGEPVVRRAGEYKRPYFAHKNHCAKPECENYHPSSHTPTLTGSPGVIPDNYNSSRNLSLNGGVFLRYSESGSYSLYLKLPRVSMVTESYGDVRVQTGLGVRRYTVSQLLQSQLVPVIPTLPLVEVTASWCLGSIGAEVKAYAEQFRSFGNYFKVSEAGGGRLLAIEEPLEWGENYLLLTQLQFASVPAIYGLKIETTECWKGWTLYDIVLPSFSDTEGEFEIRILTRFLDRAIKVPYAHAYFITPPHHIEPEGTYVYPEATERIVIKKTTTGSISVQENRQAIIKNLDDEFVEITGFEMGCFSILIDDRMELLGKIEGCDLFQPEGVRTIFDGISQEIFEPGLNRIIQHKIIENLRIECPSVRVANLLNLEQDMWTREEKSYTTHEIGKHPVDAANFGFLAWPEDDELTESKSAQIDSQKVARRLWLEGIITNNYGPETLLRFRNELNGTIIAGCPELAIGKFAWLLPYFQLIKEII
jgi:DNA polymerase IIIc chi subunit